MKIHAIKCFKYMGKGHYFYSNTEIKRLPIHFSSLSLSDTKANTGLSGCLSVLSNVSGWLLQAVRLSLQEGHEVTGHSQHCPESAPWRLNRGNP